MAEMKQIFYILWGLGMLVAVSSIFFVKPGVKIASLNPRDWKTPNWKQKENFRGPGYALMMVGCIWWAIGGLVWVSITLFG